MVRYKKPELLMDETSWNILQLDVHLAVSHEAPLKQSAGKDRIRKLYQTFKYKNDITLNAILASLSSGYLRDSTIAACR